MSTVIVSEMQNVENTFDSINITKIENLVT
jgi:hypothetical protein